MAASAGDRNAGTGWRAVLMEMLVGLREAVLRFPLATIFLLATAIQAHLLIADIHLFGSEGQGRFNDDSDLVLGFASGALAALAATLFGEARGYSRPARSTMALVAGLVAFALMALPQTFLVLQWTLVPALLGLVPVAPFVGRGGSGAFWMFSARAAFAALLGLLALLLLAGGISAILASLTLLFELAVPDELYSHVWAFTGLFAAPLFAMGQLPDRFDEEPGTAVTGFMDRGMRALGDFLAAPLLILYAVILHLYALKIVVTGEVPQGQIGWLVLVYGLCIFGTLIIINPFFDRARAPTRAFLRLWPFFLPVPLALLFYAVALRVGEFGITPERFLLGLFGAVTTLILALQLFPRMRGDIRVIAGVPVVALILVSFGPQGALGLSLRSQTTRFLEIVENPPVEGARHEQALGALTFLESQKALSRVAPEGTDIPPNADNAYMETAKAWGLDPSRRFSGPRGFSFDIGPETAVFTVKGFDTMIQYISVSVESESPVSARLPSGREVSFTLEENALVVMAGEEIVRFPISGQDIEGMARLDGAGRPVEIPVDADGRRMMLMPNYIYADLGDPPRLTSFQGAILLRSEDWR
ncbi:DUF4153 domain-containing protein [Chelativorans xinjiangense]|uniref:DUF4153 domain-containing protein n=1 Tax=Chelativorans xinjiangense TaxID=2681485 RepID=UPI00135A2577|nr:DUF4153 domain-containing protein [Chelativorans xinjiangense]